MDELDLDIYLNFKKKHNIGSIIKLNSCRLNLCWNTDFRSFLYKLNTFDVYITYIGRYGFTCHLINTNNEYSDRQISISYKDYC